MEPKYKPGDVVAVRGQFYSYGPVRQHNWFTDDHCNGTVVAVVGKVIVDAPIPEENVFGNSVSYVVNAVNGASETVEDIDILPMLDRLPADFKDGMRKIILHGDLDALHDIESRYSIVDGIEYPIGGDSVVVIDPELVYEPCLIEVVGYPRPDNYQDSIILNPATWIRHARSCRGNNVTVRLTGPERWIVLRVPKEDSDG